LNSIATRKERMAVRDFALHWVAQQEKQQAMN